MILQSAAANYRASTASDIISQLSTAATDIITAVKAPGGTVGTTSITPATTISSRANMFWLLVIAGILFFLLYRK